jgi:predicted GNAT family acetyltransferase
MSALAAMVRDNSATHRYELVLDGVLVGDLMYRTRDDVVTLIHTEIAPAFEGHGFGDRLVAGALDDIRARELQIVPVCPFVAAYIRSHPEYESLVRSREEQ